MNGYTIFAVFKGLLKTMRLQGTDGIRGVVKPAGEMNFEKKSSLEVFLKSGFLTEEFFELYCFGFATYLLKSGRLRAGEGVAIGWDPRDLTGDFTSRAVIGLRKAGVSVRELGMVPTPAVPLYMCSEDLQAGIVITASHNPADQNGIKIFLTPRGLKPLPEEEKSISDTIIDLDPDKLKNLSLTGIKVDCREDVACLFKAFHVDPDNSWDKTGRAFRAVRLVIDASNGACSGLAAEVFLEAGFKEVMEVSVNPEDGINNNCGVVGFENISVVRSASALRKNKFIEAMFREAENHRESTAKGKEFIIGVAFDGDGDRFILAIHDPKKDAIHLLSGDEIAIHQAKYMMESDPEALKGSLYVNTVESDLQCSVEAAKLGLKVEKTGVGDKWLLTKAAESNDRFAIGSERSGHIITGGYLTNGKKERTCLFAGNGIKGALNVIAAIRSLYMKTGNGDWVDPVVRPFRAGFNTISYIYYTAKERWRRDSKIWMETKHRMESCVKTTFGVDVSIQEKIFSEERDLLFCEIFSGDGCLRASVHVRNSGTEDKTGITVKGSVEDRDLLSGLVEFIFKELAVKLKKTDHPFCAAQNKLVRLLYPDRVMSRNDWPQDLPPKGSPDRLLKEMGKKEGMIRETESGYQLTDIGRWYFRNLSAPLKNLKKS